eukprot:6176650-Pleurochrysis_carterae.AAC.1
MHSNTITEYTAECSQQSNNYHRLKHLALGLIAPPQPRKKVKFICHSSQVDNLGRKDQDCTFTKVKDNSTTVLVIVL